MALILYKPDNQEEKHDLFSCLGLDPRFLTCLKHGELDFSKTLLFPFYSGFGSEPVGSRIFLKELGAAG